VGWRIIYNDIFKWMEEWNESADKYLREKTKETTAG